MSWLQRFRFLNGHPVWKILGVTTLVMALVMGRLLYRVLYLPNPGYLGLIYLIAAIFLGVLWIWFVLSCLFWHFIGRLLPAEDHRRRWIYSISFFLAPFIVYFSKWGAVYLYYLWVAD